MCIMVISSVERLPAILQKLTRIDISHIYFHNTDAREIGVPFVSLVPFTNLLVCEDAMLDADDFRTGMLLREANKMSIPVVTDSNLGNASAP